MAETAASMNIGKEAYTLKKYPKISFLIYKLYIIVTSIGLGLNLNLWVNFHLLMSINGMSEKEKTFKKVFDGCILLSILSFVGFSIYELLMLYDGKNDRFEIVSFDFIPKMILSIVFTIIGFMSYQKLKRNHHEFFMKNLFLLRVVLFAFLSPTLVITAATILSSGSYLPRSASPLITTIINLTPILL